MKTQLLLIVCAAVVASAQESEAPKKYPSPDGSVSITTKETRKGDQIVTLVAGKMRKDVFTGGDGIHKMFAPTAASVLKVKPSDISKVSWPEVSEVKWISPEEAQVSGTVTISLVDPDKSDYPELNYKVSVTKAGVVKLVSLITKSD